MQAQWWSAAGGVNIRVRMVSNLATVILAMMMMVMATMAQDEGSGNGLAAGSEDILSKYNVTFDFPRAMKCLNPAP